MRGLLDTEFDFIYEQLNKFNRLLSEDTPTNSLTEVKVGDFTNQGSNLYYHMFEDLSDLTSSLKSGVIYSTKNSKSNKSQYDETSAEDTSYVCMTSTFKGKQYTMLRNRPFGIAFTKEALDKLCADNKYDIRPYSVFDSRIAYRATSNDNTSKDRDESDTVYSPVDSEKLFYITAIGQLTKDLYFVCASQGGGVSWLGQTFTDTDLYDTLREWLMKNMQYGGAYQQQEFYYFKNGDLGDPIANPTAFDKDTGLSDEKKAKVVLNCTGNKNKKYRPFITKEGAYIGAINFNTLSGQYAHTFIEIIGCGKINVKDQQGKTLLALDYVHSSAKGAYHPPCVFGKSIETGRFNDDKNITYSKGTNRLSGQYIDDDSKTKAVSAPYHLMLNEPIYNKLYDIFDEHETRIYIPSGRDFRYSLKDIAAVILPKTCRCNLLKTTTKTEQNGHKKVNTVVTQGQINLETLVRTMGRKTRGASAQRPGYTGSSTLAVTNRTQFIKQLIDKNVITTKDGESIKDYYKNVAKSQYDSTFITHQPLSTYVCVFLETLVAALSKMDPDVEVELIPSDYDLSAVSLQDQDRNYVLLAGKRDSVTDMLFGNNVVPDGEVEKPKLAGVAEIEGKPQLKASHQRILVTTLPDLTRMEKVQGENGEFTYLAPISLTSNGTTEEVLARIGAQALVYASNSLGQLYLLFVANPKTNNFLELPGGGFKKPLDTTNDSVFKALLEQQLKLKCGLSTDDYFPLEPCDRNLGLLLDETKVAKSKEVTWPYSYYKLYFTAMRDLLDTDKHLDYTFDNRELAKSLSTAEYPVNGFNAYLRWIPIDDDAIFLNRAVTSRYSNLIRDIIMYKNSLIQHKKLPSKLSIKQQQKNQDTPIDVDGIKQEDEATDEEQTDIN